MVDWQNFPLFTFALTINPTEICKLDSPETHALIPNTLILLNTPVIVIVILSIVFKPIGQVLGESLQCLFIPRLFVLRTSRILGDSS